jgi:hypothetical protein
MSERTCLMINIEPEMFSKASKLSIKYRIPSPKCSETGIPSNVAGLVRALLYLQVRRYRVKCEWVEQVPVALKTKLEEAGFLKMEFTREAETTGALHRQVRCTDEFKAAIEALSEKLGVPYGRIARDCLRFSINNI